MLTSVLYITFTKLLLIPEIVINFESDLNLVLLTKVLLLTKNMEHYSVVFYTWRNNFPGYEGGGRFRKKIKWEGVQTFCMLWYCYFENLRLNVFLWFVRFSNNSEFAKLCSKRGVDLCNCVQSMELICAIVFKVWWSWFVQVLFWFFFISTCFIWKKFPRD